MPEAMDDREEWLTRARDIYAYPIYQPLCSGRIWHKVIVTKLDFLAIVNELDSHRVLYGTSQLFKQSLTGLNSEFFSRLVASPRLKNLVSPTIYPKLEGE